MWYRDEQDFLNELGEEFWKFPPVYFLESFIIEMTDKASLNALKDACVYHDELVKNLKEGDTIISFNYDLIIDASVWKKGCWSELGGYGFPCFELLKSNKENLFDLERPSNIVLLKPHGSLNWEIYRPLKLSTFKTKEEHSPIKISSFQERMSNIESLKSSKISINLLRDIVGKQSYKAFLTVKLADYYDSLFSMIPDEHRWKISSIESPQRKIFILPPMPCKFEGFYFSEELIWIWSNIKTALSTARKIICIGYSFRNTDVEFDILFRLAIRNNKNKDLKIEIVNPDKKISKKLHKEFPNIKVEHVADSLSSYISTR